QLIALEPDAGRYRLQRARILCDHARWSEAVVDLGKVVDCEPASVSTLLLLARAQVALTNCPAAMQTYTRAISRAETAKDISPHDLQDAYRERSALLASLQRFDEARQDKLRAMGVPERDPGTKPQQLDLSGFYNFGLDENLHGFAGNNFSALPKGLQEFRRTEFDVRGLVQLANRGPLESTCPSQITGILVGQKCHRIHFLHATGWGGSVSPGMVIGKYVLHFAGGQTANVD